MSYYKVTQGLHDALISYPDVNVVTMGDLFDVDLQMQTIFGLSHIQVMQADLGDNAMEFSVEIYVLGNIDFNKENAKNLPQQFFYGNDNLHDAWNWTLTALNDVTQRARKGDLWDNKIQLINTPSASPFKQRFETLLAGWQTTLNLAVPNEHKIC